MEQVYRIRNLKEKASERYHVCEGQLLNITNVNN